MKTCDNCRNRHKCTKCDFKCSCSSKLKRHIKQVHDKIKDHACTKCDFKCSTSGDLKKHIKQVHDKIKDYACTKCDFKCSSSSQLKTHIKMVHDKIKDFECSTCDYKCSTSSTLKAHIKICTGSLNISSGELICRKALELLNISYETECCELKNDEDNWLRFDFKIELNGNPAFIEYDGKAHFKPVRFGGISQDQADVNFIKQQAHDQKKNAYCSDHNYPLLRIPFYRFDEVMKLIREFVQSSDSN